MASQGPDIQSASDALLWLDFMARFADGSLSHACSGIAVVVRDLAGRLERQAMQMERDEAARRKT